MIHWLELSIAGMCLLSFALGYAAAELSRAAPPAGPPARNPRPLHAVKPATPPPAPPCGPCGPCARSVPSSMP